MFSPWSPQRLRGVPASSIGYLGSLASHCIHHVRLHGGSGNQYRQDGKREESVDSGGGSLFAELDTTYTYEYTLRYNTPPCHTTYVSN